MEIQRGDYFALSFSSLILRLTLVQYCFDQLPFYWFSSNRLTLSLSRDSAVQINPRNRPVSLIGSTDSSNKPSPSTRGIYFLSWFSPYLNSFWTSLCFLQQTHLQLLSRFSLLEWSLKNVGFSDFDRRASVIMFDGEDDSIIGNKVKTKRILESFLKSKRPDMGELKERGILSTDGLSFSLVLCFLCFYSLPYFREHWGNHFR